MVVSGAIGAISFFAFEEFLGQHRATILIASGLVFFSGFFALSVYTYAKWQSHTQRVRMDRALADWLEYAGSAPRADGQTRELPGRTLESIAVCSLASGGYRPISDYSSYPDGFIRLVNETGEIVLVQCRQDSQQFGLNDALVFHEALYIHRATSGEVWALGGFTPDACHWVRNKPIRLRDAQAIQIVVDGLMRKKIDDRTG